jgi:hypothetical protein
LSFLAEAKSLLSLPDDADISGDTGDEDAGGLR